LTPPAIEITTYLAAARGATPAPKRLPAAALGPDDLLVAVEHVALGAPELATLRDRPGVAPGGAAVGHVVATGTAAGDHLGRRVLVGPHHACGECDACRRGKLASCTRARRLGDNVDGALASHVVAARRWVCPLDGALANAAPGPEAVLLARDAPLAYALATRAGLGAGDVSLWLGDGPVAALGRAIARSLGSLVATPATPSPDDHTAAWIEAIRAALAGEAHALPPPAIWRVFDTTGAAANRRAVAALARAGATLGLLEGRSAGLAHDDLTSLGAALAGGLAHELVLFGVAVAHPDLMPEIAALAARGQLVLAERVHVFPVARLADAIAAASAAGDERLVVVSLGQ
jgi:threonine dehydrogenase-like Zn-dependent dehydrogenase